MPLTAGDIAFVQYNASGADNFAFIALVDLPGNEVVYFTDNGWQSTTNSLRATEGTLTWTTPAAGVAAGTIVTISGFTVDTPLSTVGTVSETGDINLAIAGDQVLAYQGSAAAPTLIAAINNEGNQVFQADATNANTSALPPGLTLGVDAVALQEIDNAIYNGTLLSATKAELLAAINNPANWVGNDTINQTFVGSFSVTGGPPLPSVNLSVSQTTGSEADTPLITVTATASSPVSGNQTVTLGITGIGITAGDYSLSDGGIITILHGQTTGSITFTIVDDEGTESTEIAILTLSDPSVGIVLGNTISQAIILTDNDTPPTTANAAVTFNEDTVFSFNNSLFPFADADAGDTLQGIRVTQLPTAGQLFLDANGNDLQDGGEAITVDQDIAVANLSQLKFSPAAKTNGTPYTSFQFQVSDGRFLSTVPGTIVLNVTPVNNAPTGNESITSAPTSAVPPTTAPPPLPPTPTPTQLISLDNQVLSVIGDSPTHLKATITGQGAQSVFDIAMVVVDDAAGRVNGLLPSDGGYVAAALERATTLMSVLKAGDFEGLFGQRTLPLVPGQFLQFALIQGGTLDDLKRGGVGQILFATGPANGDGLSAVQYSQTLNGLTLDFRLPGSATPSVTLQLDPAPASLGSSLQGTSAESELIDLTGLATPTATLTLEVFREAAFNNVVGFYTVEDRQGRVRDPLTGTLLSPGDGGYQQAALGNRVIDSLAGHNGRTLTYTAEVATGQLLSTFLVIDGSLDALLDTNPTNDSVVFFNHIAANGDGQDHVRLLGDNTFGYEDLWGGGDRDFNDLIVQVSVQ